MNGGDLPVIFCSPFGLAKQTMFKANYSNLDEGDDICPVL